ncbi:MAG TPA: hypothetical protein VFG65_00560 [Fimbriimonadales bacterium]|nr:hypothetical protein [Fimbriimonadales bacterium]
MRRRALTIAEVLVVLLVIAIAAAVVAPVWAHVKDAARRAACLSKLRKLGVGMAIYIEESDKKLPLSAGWVAAVSAGSDFAIMHCPSSLPAGIASGVDVSYTYNGYLNGYPITQIPSLASTVAVWEGMGKAVSRGNPANPRLICPDPASPCVFQPQGGPKSAFDIPKGTMWVHGRGANFLLGDGHAQWRRLGPKEGKPTNPRIDPFMVYDRKGVALEAWTDDGTGTGKALLFMPRFH